MLLKDKSVILKEQIFHNDQGNYQGDKLDGKRHGLGTFELIGGDNTVLYKYVGEWQNDRPHGQGKMQFQSLDPFEEYEGLWQQGQPHSQGKVIFNTGDIYEGEFKDGKPHGQGKYIIDSDMNTDVYIYEGEFLDSLEHGRGKMTIVDENGEFKSVYEGGFEQGSRHGYGVEQFADGTIQEGDWTLQKIRLKITFPNGDVFHSQKSFAAGDTQENIDGTGLMEYANGAIYYGYWNRGRRDGYGAMTYPDGTMFEGMWQQDEKISISQNSEVGKAAELASRAKTEFLV